MAYFGRKVESGAGPFLFGADISLPDLVLFSTLNGIATGDWDHIPPTVTDTYPWAAKLREAVRSHPAVVKFGGLPAPK